MIVVDSIRNITIEDRLRGAVWGQFVGDAAALGTHWIYDLQELRSKFPRGINGFETPQESTTTLVKRQAIKPIMAMELSSFWNRSPLAVDLNQERLGRHLSARSIRGLTLAIWTGRPKERLKILGPFALRIPTWGLTSNREPMTTIWLLCVSCCQLGRALLAKFGIAGDGPDSYPGLSEQRANDSLHAV